MSSNGVLRLGACPEEMGIPVIVGFRLNTNTRGGYFSLVYLLVDTW